MTDYARASHVAKVTVIMFVFGVYGCGVTSKQLKQQANDVTAACDAKMQAGVYKTHYQKAECLNEGLTNMALQNDYQYMDLVRLSNAYRLAVAERVDKGKLTKTEAEVIMAELLQKIVTEEQTRETNAAYARAAQNQGTAALLQGLGALKQQRQPLQRQPITCTQMGNVVNCF